jgi:hypothetical protein
MKIYVLGAGAIGVHRAAGLPRDGAGMSIMARGAHPAELQAPTRQAPTLELLVALCKLRSKASGRYQ